MHGRGGCDVRAEGKKKMMMMILIMMMMMMMMIMSPLGQLGLRAPSSGVREVFTSTAHVFT
jgi:hypothetical protein